MNSDALTGGHWVLRRGIRVWAGPRDQDHPSYFEPLPAVHRLAVDPVKVQLALAGFPRHALTPAERRIAVRHLHTRGMSDAQIAHRIGCSDRTVLRARNFLGLPPNFDHAGQLVAA